MIQTVSLSVCLSLNRDSLTNINSTRVETLSRSMMIHAPLSTICLSLMRSLSTLSVSYWIQKLLCFVWPSFSEDRKRDEHTNSNTLETLSCIPIIHTPARMVSLSLMWFFHIRFIMYCSSFLLDHAHWQVSRLSLFLSFTVHAFPTITSWQTVTSTVNSRCHCPVKLCLSLSAWTRMNKARHLRPKRVSSVIIVETRDSVFHNADSNCFSVCLSLSEDRETGQWHKLDES